MVDQGIWFGKMWQFSNVNTQNQALYTKPNLTEGVAGLAGQLEVGELYW